MGSKMQSKIKKSHQNPLFGATLGDLGDRLWDQIIIIIFIMGILKLALAAWQSHPSPAICVLFDFAHFVNFNIHQKGFRMKLILIYMQLKTAHAPQKKSSRFKYELRRPEGAVVASFKSLLVRFHAAQLQYSSLQRDMCFCPE